MAVPQDAEEPVCPENFRKTLKEGSFAVPDITTKIYKEECTYCFRTPFFPGGLFICLKTYACFCFTHVGVYAEQSHNTLFLHISSKKVPLESEEESDGEPKDKITRLAIGVDSGFDSKKLFDVVDSYSLVSFPHINAKCPVDEKLGADLYGTCQYVISATSAERIALLQNASNAWDGEIKQVTKHANLVQVDNGKKIPLSGWQCEADGCTLTENLWLNLTDGAIRCGRSQFVAEGQMCKGNNHMKQYYDATGFPLVVKLGTISSEGTADVFSYDEDDAVVDPNLEKHLAHFGIDAKNLKKTEKSTLELELDMNQKWEWAKCQEDGASLESIFGPGYTGLINIGSSCYMNSVVQSLLVVPSFVTRFVDGAGPILARVPPLDVHLDFNGQVAKLFAGMASGDYSLENSDLNGIKPSQFKRVIAGNHPEFSSSRQQDAEEYVRYTLKTLPTCNTFSANRIICALLSVYRFLLDKISSNTPVEAKDPTLSVKFKMESRFEDIASAMVRYTDREETVLAVPIPKAAIRASEVEGGRSSVALTDCLGALFEPELIEDFVSPVTHEKKGARTTLRFRTFPDFLFLQAQRFTMSPDYTIKKLDLDLQVPDELDLSGLRGIGKKENEVLLPDDAATAPPPLPDYDRNIVEQLEAMGFTRNASIKAAIETGKSGGVEAAAEWVMLRLDDPSLNDPPAAASGVAEGGSAHMEGLDELIAFGFTAHQARYALSRNPDANAAAEWLFVHAEEVPPECGAAVPGENTTPLAASASREFSDGSGKYRLVAFISHMGSSPHSGHYVVHVKKDGRWILFNDEKVAISQNPPRQLAYLYLFQRIEQ
ncbi:UBA/TS-N domain protein [Oesophagostomum dentatum]|uniref:Ubiquitin carboxyl-terminal hydrolase n=1 Tax=Oesophagostomum dentatum TaxID=61180 RepID=A0A0B1TMW6_OESDE|nr:UBA/TS-N domain protein [Oesophagostomum dentatum]